jgi:hypothetical protein
VNLGVAERETLLAIIETSDPRVSANERLRAIEMLSEAGGSDQNGALWIARWITAMSDDELAVVMRGFYPPPAEGSE